MNRKNLSESIYRMAIKGGYVLAFSKAVARDIPDLTWPEYHRALQDNSGFCGYADSAIRAAFGR